LILMDRPENGERVRRQAGTQPAILPDPVGPAARGSESRRGEQTGVTDS
jgi:hypothetical protein